LAQVKVKQSTMEKEQVKLRKRATSLEVAYKKISGKNKVATSSKKTKPVAKKTSATKVTQKKSSAKPQSVTKKTPGTSTRKTESPKVSTRESEKIEDTNAPQPYSPAPTSEKPAPVEKPSEEQKTASAHESDVKRINEKGIEYGRQGKYDEAIREFQKVAAIEPNMANIHYNLGLAYKKKGMAADAEKEFAEYERLKGQESQNN
ncbi:MAG TPA: tetratricopeptide repeat protein, partial [Candidatus Brocadiaceae bacterium]